MDRYEEALERAKAGKPMDEVFPELKESEDERIRKEIIRYLKSKVATAGEEELLYFKRWIAYLEKQKEREPVKLNDDTEVGLDRALQIVKNENENLRYCQSDDGIYECDHAIQTLERILKNWIEQQPAHTAKEMWKEMRLEVYAQASGNRHEPNYSDDSTKMFSLYDIDEIFEKIGNSTVWSQPAEWSEEDERMLVGIIERGRAQIPPHEPALRGDQMEWLMNRLKTLRPQPNTVSIKDATKFGNLEYERGVKDGIQSEKSRHWKPSKEQMEELLNALTPGKDFDCDILAELYVQLKKL